MRSRAGLRESPFSGFRVRYCGFFNIFEFQREERARNPEARHYLLIWLLHRDFSRESYRKEYNVSSCHIALSRISVEESFNPRTSPRLVSLASSLAEDAENFGNFGPNFTATKFVTVACEFPGRYSKLIASRWQDIWSFIYAGRLHRPKFLGGEPRGTTSRSREFKMSPFRAGTNPRRCSLPGLCQSGCTRFLSSGGTSVERKKHSRYVRGTKRNVSRRRINRASRVKLPHHVESSAKKTVRRRFILALRSFPR